VYPDLRTTNGWDSSYKIDFTNPCSQAYLDSIAHEFANWGIDFLKLDGVGPGSEKTGPNHDNTSDVQAWATALAGTHRPIQFIISWALDHSDIATWQTWTNGWRIEDDVECYCATLVQWDRPINSVRARFTDVPAWAGDARPGGWNNLDSLDVGNGTMDGLTNPERQSYMTLWAIEAAPLYTGDDLTRLDAFGTTLLTNDEVIAVDQAGTPARPISTATGQQVWWAHNRDGSYTVALFNLDSAPTAVTAHFSDFALSGTATVRDLWRHTTLPDPRSAITRTLPAHGSALYRIVPTK
jgi:Alpha galactosidase A/Alpha galactosidase C-terminal beta sandwich domain